MPAVRCGGGLWCGYHLCWAVIVPLRLGMSAYGGVRLFIELGINEAINVSVVDAAVHYRDIGFCTLAGKDFLDYFGVELFS
eukprot:746434-Pelagomonas_calceolata.AAC.1